MQAIVDDSAEVFEWISLVILLFRRVKKSRMGWRLKKRAGNLWKISNDTLVSTRLIKPDGGTAAF